MPLTNEEKTKIRWHLGYPMVGTTAASIQHGMVRPMQLLFLVDRAMTLVLEDGLPIVRDLIFKMDDNFRRQEEAQDRLAATQLEELHLNHDEMEQLKDQYVYWGLNLAQALGAPINWTDPRYQGRMPGGVNGTVRCT